MKITSLTFLFAFCLLLTGCASNQQFVRFPDQTKTIEDPSKGRIYVLRPTVVGSAAFSMEVDDAGKIVGNIGPGGFLCWERDPGDTVISSRSENTSVINLNVEAGKANYIFEHMRLGWATPRTELEIVSQDEGKKVLKECHPPTVIK